MVGCGVWIRDKDDIAVFRCGDKSSKGIELCLKCREHLESNVITSRRTLFESLSSLEHDQWMMWSKSIAKDDFCRISEAKLEDWQRLWIPYEELSEYRKNQDRFYAEKVINIFINWLSAINKSEIISIGNLINRIEGRVEI